MTTSQGDFGYINAIKIQRNLTEREANILIDFGPAGGRHSVGSADANGNWWSYVTGVTGSGGNVTNLTTMANVTSTVTIALNWTGEVGVNGDPLVNWAINSGEVDASLNDGRFGFFDVVKNGVYFNSSLTPSITLSGLDNSKVYNLTFYGARGGSTRTTTYAVGANSASLQTGTASPAGWNTSNVVRLEGLAPSSGVITINLSATGGFGYLNAMQIEAAVQASLTNSVAMLGPDHAPLPGDATSGYLVQLIAVGPNGVIDAPATNTYGQPGGDDYLVPATHNPTYAGAGMATPDLGRLVQDMVYSESLAGSPVYVRYWNTDTPVLSSLFGESAVFYLPSHGPSGQTQVDFLPAGSSSPVTQYSIPTLGEWAMIVLVVMLVFLGSRRLLAGNPSEAS